ncbi:hypothetical protein [Phytomonospora endophytica]|uniref:Uncharacterized protein n=1 Tax=Phytomonospora endophytica TaxID=714109 RepID=A0A841FKE0_9ACTN|nr:hypothetical protein [Phytomonospora endophytica]MBB6037801.1 hypothetical protein [Phytomonospora endophytica]GIG67670.1 hypothetical protein Pen01_39650 [Phytomonospora endophytica]
METDGSAGGSSTGWGPHGRAIRDMAIEVREKANDLRMLEVLGHWGFEADDVSGSGDSNRAGVLDALGSPHEGLLLAQEAEQGFQLGTEFDYIPELFDRYALGFDPSAYEGMKIDLQAAIDTLATSTDSLITPIRHRVSEAHWSSDAANEFRDRVLDPMIDVGPNQRRILSELIAGLEGHRSLCVATQEGALQIATLTRDALDRAITSTSTSPEPATVFAVLGTALAFGSIFVPGTQGFALALAIANFGMAGSQAMGQITATSTPQATQSVIGGDTAHMITGMMRAALTGLDAGITAEEVHLAQLLDADIAEIETALQDKIHGDHLRAPRIEISAHTPTKEEFAHRD